MPSTWTKSYWYYLLQVEVWAIVLLTVVGVIMGQVFCDDPDFSGFNCEAASFFGIIGAFSWGFIPVMIFLAPFIAYYLKRRKDYEYKK